MPRSALVGVVSKLLGRAVGACLASSSALGEHTVVLELQQRPQTPGRLGLRGLTALPHWWSQTAAATAPTTQQSSPEHARPPSAHARSV